MNCQRLPHSLLSNRILFSQRSRTGASATAFSLVNDPPSNLNDVVFFSISVWEQVHDVVIVDVIVDDHDDDHDDDNEDDDNDDKYDKDDNDDNHDDVGKQYRWYSRPR